MTIQIELTQGKTAIIDEGDWGLVSGFTWCAHRVNNHWYAVSHDKKGRTIMMHRLLLGVIDPKIKVDHRDMDGLNNKRENLRPCTHRENLWNTAAGKRNTSGFKGVWLHKQSGKWRAAICANGKRHNLGYYPTPVEAHMAYCEAAIDLHGEFCNFGYR